MSTGAVVNFRRVNCFAADGELDAWCQWHEPGRRVADYLPADCANFLAKQGNTIDDPTQIVPEPGDTIELLEAPEGGAELALILIPIIAATVLSAGSYLAQRYLVAGPTESDFAGPQGPTNSFGGVQTVSAAGVPLPLLYGEVKVAGNVVDAFESPGNDQDFVIPADEFEFKKGVTNQILTAQSRSNVRMIICEGPIEDIGEFRVDDRDIEEFPGLIVTRRLGTQHQPSIPEFNRIATTRVLALPVSQAAPATFTTSQPVEEVQLVLRFPQGIYKLKDDGIRFNRLVELEVAWQLEGADTSESESFTIDGFAVNPLEYRIRLPRLDRAVYEITVTRISPDEVTDPQQNNFSAFEISFVNEIDYDDRNHPGVAQMAFSQLPGEQVSPVQPSNYTAIAKGFNNIRQYTSEEEFTVGYTNNPAWCCGHFLTRERGALSRHFTWDDIDIPSFLEWAQYCDALVEDGNSALEARATYNRLIDTRGPAFDIVQSYAVGAGATVIYSGSKWRIVPDIPKPRTQIFHEGNTLDGQLSKIYLPASQLPTRIHVQFNNAEIGYERDAIMQEDDSQGPGVFQAERTYQYLWITRPGQAAREAKRVSLANVLLRRAVTFKAGLQAIGMQFGDRFGVASYGLNVGLGSGNVKAVSADELSLLLDDEILFEAGKDYGISVQHQFDGEITTVPIVHLGDGVCTDRVTVVSAVWLRRVRAGDQYAVGELDTQIEDYKADDVQINDLGGEDFSVTVRGGKYDERLFDITPTSNESIPLNERPTQLTTPGPVRNLNVIFSPAEPESYVGRRPSRTLEVDWDPPENGFLVDYYEIFMREFNVANQQRTWRFVGAVNGVRYEIADNIDIETKYEVTVRGVSPNGLRMSIDKTPKRNVETY